MHTQYPHTNRRAIARRAADRAHAPVWLTERTANGEYLYCATDMSEGGAFFDRALPKPLGTKLCLELELPDDERAIAVECRVVRASDSGEPGMAVQFTQISAEGYYRIRRYVREAGMSDLFDRRTR